VEALLERDEPRATGRLARDLERRLVRLGTRAAEERLRAARPFGEQRGEREHRLGPVEVRRVPKAVELRVRGGRDGRVAMAQPDDRDSPAEVEIRPARVVPHTAALPPDDRQVGAGVRRQNGAAVQAL
jgi:hypothetical protein